MTSCSTSDNTTNAQAGYVNPRTCEGCHAGIAASYRETGMARAFHKIDSEEVPGQTFTHDKSGRTYQFVKREDKVFLRRTEAGGENAIEKEIQYVLGSGNHAQSFIHRTPQGRLIEMPVNWYPEDGGKVAMSPGYDRPDHMDMRRAIGYQCAFCHNGYASAKGTSLLDDPVFEGELPEGIDCQRCHGPGREHVAEGGRGKILNPKKLPGARKMEVCMQCHLETTSFSLPNSIVRFDQKIFGYNPVNSLESFVSHFDHAKGGKEEEKFEIAGSAYRLRQSACFRGSKEELTCTTCHNPHQKTANVDAACVSCHKQIAGIEKHPAKADCGSCHMPKRRTEDVIHVAVTDHKIQRPDGKLDLMAKREERHEVMGKDSYQGEVVSYYPSTHASDLYPALAQVIHQSNLKNGVPRLEAALAKEQPKEPAFYVHMAQALHASGESAKATGYYQKALALDAKFLPALRSMGASQLRAGDLAGAAGTLEKTVGLRPGDSLAWLELGRVYRGQRKLSEAAKAARKAAELEPELVEAHKLLGVVLEESGDRVGAEAAFRAALAEQPDEAECRGNLANLLLAKGDAAGAEKLLKVAVTANAAARFNYAVLLAQQKRYDEALEQATGAPRSVGSLELIGNLRMARREFRLAEGAFREGLKLEPGSGRLQVGLGTALGAMNDFSGARRFLTLAAQGTDAGAKAEASELLRTLPK